MASITLPSFFSTFFQALTRLWTFARNWVVTHHIPFFLLFAYTCVRIAVSTVSTIINAIYTSVVTAQQLVVNNQSAGSGIQYLTYFQVANSFFPIPETFTFLASILALRTALWAYVLLRSVYKNIPLKSS